MRLAHIRSVLPSLLLAAAQGLAVTPGALAAGLAVEVARPAGADTATAFDGVVEAVRQTAVASQVPGAVVQLDVKVGDRVSAGQVLLRLDARAAAQNVAASNAQVQAARAVLDMAGKEFERQRQLFQKNYISQAALERAESEFKSTRAQVDTQLAQAAVARTQTDFYVVRAPFAGVVSELPVSLGDMAMPGRTLLTLYDPGALRVTAAVPQSVSARLPAGVVPRIEIPTLGEAQKWVQPLSVQLLPTVDPGTHTVQMRADLPAGLAMARPGMYARLWLPVAVAGQAPLAAAVLSVSRGAVVRRAELTGLYVLDADERPVLRQVRLGRIDGDKVEILSGLMPGERVASDPQAAARAQPKTR